jgi:hypothetical protein
VALGSAHRQTGTVIAWHRKGFRLFWTWKVRRGQTGPGPDTPLERPTGLRPDRGQTTHFLTGRNWGVFTVTVPKDFGSTKLGWSLTANGATTQVPTSLVELWELAPFQDANGNTAPWTSFQETGP